jgi:SRSO17 transposase
VQRTPDHQPVSAKQLAERLPARAWRTLTWREGSSTAPTSRFAAQRVRPAHRAQKRREPWPEEWLLVEGPKGAQGPSKSWLSNLPPRSAVREFVHTAKARRLIERDCQELKQEIGLGHSEGRGWRGFHHHASLCIAACGFLTAERCLFPPSVPLHPPAPRRTGATQGFSAARRPRSGLSGRRHIPSVLSATA